MLIISGVIVVNLFINMISKVTHQVKTIGSIGIFTFGLLPDLVRINSRTTEFSYIGHIANYDKFEAESKRIQRKILGEKSFNIMTEIDNKILLNF